MARIIKVKNNSGAIGTWVGQQIADTALFTVPEYRLAQWRNDSKVTTDIASGNLQVIREDGPTELYYSAEDGQRTIDGFPLNLASTRGAFNVIIFARKQVSGTINKGIPVHISGYDVTDDVYLVEVADSDSSSFPAAGIVCTTNLSEVDIGHVVINGRLEKYNTSSWTEGDELYVSSTGTLTNTRPTGIANKVQRIGQVLYSHVTNGVVGIMGSHTENDVPNITNGKVWMGDGSDLPIETDVYTEAEADSLLAGKLANIVEDTTPQIGGMLDVNGFAIGDGTNELITFVEDPSAVNNIEIENQTTGGGPIIRAAGPDTNIDLVLDTKGTGDIDASTNKIINVVDPTAAQDAATKNYVDTTGVTGGTIELAQITGMDSQSSGLMAFVVDTSRANKKLSIESSTLVWVEQITDDMDWIDIHKTGDGDAGYVMPFDGTVVVSTVFTESAAGSTFNMELYINETKTTTLGILTGAIGVNVQDGHSDLNVDFVAGDKLRVRGERTAGTTSLGDTIVTAWVKWRTT